MTLGSEFRDLADELTGDDDFGSLVSWKRDTVTSDPAAGTVTVTATTTFAIKVAIASQSMRKHLPDEVATISEHVLFVAAKKLPFAIVAPATAPEVSFDDRVWWETGRVYRVRHVQEHLGPGGAGAPVPIGYLVALVG